jgi:hypothetical protein
MVWIKEVFEEHQVYVTDYPDGAAVSQDHS